MTDQSQIPGDRGPLSVPRRSSLRSALAPLLLIGTGVGLVFLLTMGGSSEEAPKAPALESVEAPPRLRLPEIKLPEPPAPPPEAAKAEEPPSPPVTPEPAMQTALLAPPAPMPAYAAAQAASPDPIVARKNESPLIVYNQDGRQGGGGTNDGELAARLRSTSTERVSAAYLGDLSYIIPKGTMLDCVLETALDSTVPGMTKCILSRDTYSGNGQRLLLPRGSSLVGEYEGGIQQGQARIFVLWSRALTPGGVAIDIASPGTDALGRGGIDGYVDTHFWARFGGSLLLSLVGDLSDTAADQATGNDFDRTRDTGRDAASIAVENSIAIKPTLHVNQGKSIRIFVARDLDFRAVIEDYSIHAG